MEVRLASHAGFCFGVKRAVDMCYSESEKDRKVYTYGPIIHNDLVIRDLEKRGVYVINSPEELQDGEDATVIIRSHGISEKEYEALRSKHVNIVNATCPFVDRIHKIVHDEYEKGAQIVIIGSPSHPEVQGTNGWCRDSAVIIENEQQARDYRGDKNKKHVIVAQTTFNYRKFQYIVDILRKMSYDTDVMNTICNATEERQTEARLIASESDAMLVIGGKSSSNTQKLVEICRQECPNTYFIQTLDDLELIDLKSFRSVGITAGASTPNYLIKEVRSHVRGTEQ